MTVKGTTYFAKTNISERLIDLLKEHTTGKKNYKRMFKEWLLHVRCFFQGHQMTKDIWRSGTNENWYEEKDFEYHVGCRRCPKFYTEKP